MPHQIQDFPNTDLIRGHPLPRLLHFIKIVFQNERIYYDHVNIQNKPCSINVRYIAGCSQLFFKLFFAQCDMLFGKSWNLQNNSRSINVRYIGGCGHLWKCILHLLSGHFQCWVQDFPYGNPGSTYDNHVNLQNKS